MTPSESDIIEIDPEGDTFVRAGISEVQGTRLMGVSSETLVGLSDVFKPMFSPKWLEGRSAHSAHDPLLLPDDDSEAMEIIFKVAHDKITIDQWPIIPTYVLPEMVIACDKYGCVDLCQDYLKNVADIWLQNQENNVGTTQSLLVSIYVAYNCDQWRAMSKLTGQLFHQASEDDIRACMDSDLRLFDLMSKQLRGILLVGHQLAMMKYNHILLDRLHRIVTVFTRSVRGRKPACSRTWIRLGLCTAALARAQQGCIIDTGPDVKPDRIRESLRAFVAELQGDDDDVKLCNLEDCWPCNNIDLQSELRYVCGVQECKHSMWINPINGFEVECLTHERWSRS